MIDRMKVYWVSDSASRITCHRNGPGMLVDTYLGEIFLKGGEWYSKVKGEAAPRGPHRGYQFAKRDVENYHNGETV